ncbi:hypothetical protein BX285_1023 [Streptomyces sp. 1114.5]|uniref:hypothetical protein n=1 Tax=unclassified Streptomyces TaxID=2593676 RepID=UPI000BD755BB|nr:MULTISPECIES: hypothetical protein [unclassified Streptomyces]RKT16676.1 hypothetical protein BX285_1023 [Streptomyces sp. 1114.5]SOB82847.1 hypothetical protein SAMN06272789_3031 [Streptomyces sp. 1331.2]
MATTTTTRDGFTTVKKCILLFGAAGAVVLGTVAVMAATGHEASSFMWFRGAILLALTPLLHRMAGRAAGGSYRDFDRLRTVSTIMPIALIGVDLIPGLCPPWYAVLQGLSALALVAVAVLTRTSAFPRQP